MLMLQNVFFLSVSEIAIFYFSILHVFKLLRLVTVLLDFSHFFTILVLLPNFLVHTLLLAIQSQV